MITILDYGLGNIGSLKNMFKRIKQNVNITSSPSEIIKSTKIVIPGVGSFDEAMNRINNIIGLREALDLKALQHKIPILGVCLGMQGMCEFLGGKLYNQSVVKHGVKEVVQIESGALFSGVNSEIEVGLYHSWAVDDGGDYQVVARSKNNVIMAIENRDSKFYGVQFHPESIMTTSGKHIIKNFIGLL